MEQITLHSVPAHHCRSFDACNWVDEDNFTIIHERTHWPSMLSTASATVHYWIDNYLYTNLQSATREGEQFGFVPEKSYYCDIEQPTWFPIFTDFEKALAFLKAKEGVEYRSE